MMVKDNTIHRIYRLLPSKKELWWVGSINLGIEILFNSYDLQDEDIIVFANSDVQIEKNSLIIIQLISYNHF